MATKSFALNSTPLAHAPGILAWAMNGYHFPKERKQMIKVMKSWPGITDDEWHDILAAVADFYGERSEH